VLFYFAREAAGASRARHSLRPLFSDGGMFEVELARMRGEIADLCLMNTARHTHAQFLTNDTSWLFDI
jgi:hypothetical protein